MTLRKEEKEDERFREELKSPLKPQSTEPSQEMKDYLKKTNSGALIEEEKRRKEKEKNKYIDYCPHCRRPNLKRTPQLDYICGFCGRTSLAPLKMAREEKKEEIEE